MKIAFDHAITFYHLNLIICFSFRMNKLDLFKIYPRHNLRFKMGEETVIDTLLLSECNG